MAAAAAAITFQRRPSCFSASSSSSSSSSSTATTKSIETSRRNFSTSHKRREFTPFTAITLALISYWLTEMVAASELSKVQSGVRNVLSKAKADGVLRMVFHDAGTFDLDEISGGMNGSIVYELDRPENAGLSKTLKILEKAKREIDKSLQVSWANLIAVAGAEAASLCGGPIIPVRLGRIDSRLLIL